MWYTTGSEWPDLVLANITASELLTMMRDRLARYGSPLPEGFVPPSGIDIDALLKQLPWPPTSAD